MLVGGCDVGSTTGKAVVKNETSVVSHSIIPSTTKPEETARAAMDEALKMAGLSSLEAGRAAARIAGIHMAVGGAEWREEHPVVEPA